MIDLQRYLLFRENIATLKNLSKDDHDKQNIEYMTESSIEAVDFDIVKRKYVNALQLSEEVAKSNDALLKMKNDFIFIEFKNGKVNPGEIKQKITDSLLILCDITGITIKETREELDFMLVINEKKNIGRIEAAKRKIGNHYLSKARKTLILFGLEKYETLYFKSVYTCTEVEFDRFLANRL